MITNSNPKSDVLFTESPVSWNTRYINPEGFECQLTLRGDIGQKLLEKANAAMAYAFLGSKIGNPLPLLAYF